MSSLNLLVSVGLTLYFTSLPFHKEDNAPPLFLSLFTLLHYFTLIASGDFFCVDTQQIDCLFSLWYIFTTAYQNLTDLWFSPLDMKES